MIAIRRRRAKAGWFDDPIQIVDQSRSLQNGGTAAGLQLARLQLTSDK